MTPRLPGFLRHAPGFWASGGVVADALGPIAAIWAAVARANLLRPPRGRVEVPVVAIGNFTLGGAGKTPMVQALARAARAAGMRPAVVTRGYGGSLEGPVAVDPRRHGAAEVGDEALLHARGGPTVVARDRLAGARAAVAEGADLILLDDGFHTSALKRDLAIVVVDRGAGIGNGRVCPAGPLRAWLDDQIARADAVVLIGTGEPDAPSLDEVRARAGARGLPVLEAAVRAREPERFAGWRVLAWAGIGRPEKFAATLRGIGADVVDLVGFGDHELPSTAEAERLVARAAAEGLALVTTEKDLARLGGERTPALARLAWSSEAVAIELAFEGADPWALVAARLERRRNEGG